MNLFNVCEYAPIQEAFDRIDNRKKQTAAAGFGPVSPSGKNIPEGADGSRGVRRQKRV